MNRKQKLKRQRIADGICVDCGKIKPKAGCKRCQDCLDYNKAHRNTENTAKRKKELKEERRDLGLCVHCGNQTPCIKCSKAQKQYSKTKRKKRKANGLCTRCNKNNKYQRYSICQDCRKKERQKLRKDYIDLGLCRTCGKNPIRSDETTLCQQCTDRLKHNRKARREKHRQQVLQHYGNKCACCGETEEHFLTIDHINNDGAKHKRALKRTDPATMRKWIIDNNYPDIFQILCYNCNCAKGKLGYCPHSKVRLGNP